MSIGGTPKPPPGVAAASVPVQYPAPVTAGPNDCTPEGQDPAVYGNKPCCTHAIHPHPNHSGNGQMECCEINNSSGDCHRQ